MTTVRNVKELKPIRKLLRKQQTDQERILWRRLRNRQLHGLKFYRQYSIGSVVIDFYCHEKKLGIELDGGQHNEPDVALLDSERTEYLNKLGMNIIRFWNNDITNNLNGVLESIALKCQSNSP